METPQKTLKLCVFIIKFEFRSPRCIKAWRGSNDHMASE